MKKRIFEVSRDFGVTVCAVDIQKLIGSDKHLEDQITSLANGIASLTELLIDKGVITEREILAALGKDPDSFFIEGVSHYRVECEGNKFILISETVPVGADSYNFNEDVIVREVVSVCKSWNAAVAMQDALNVSAATKQ